MRHHIFRALLFTCLLGHAANAQSGGTFQITQSVLTGGGGTSDRDNFSLAGTVGQSISGTRSSGSGASGSFTVQGGFWTSNPLGPTAAPVTISGRITSPDRIGMRRLFVEIINAATGEVRLMRPNIFGYFSFKDLPIGSYILRGVSRNYSFSPEQRVIDLYDDMSGVDFTAFRIMP